MVGIYIVHLYNLHCTLIARTSQSVIDANSNGGPGKHLNYTYTSDRVHKTQADAQADAHMMNTKSIVCMLHLFVARTKRQMRLETSSLAPLQLLS